MNELIKIFSDVRHVMPLLIDKDFILLLKDIEQWKKK
jgi:hypothetical protein